MSRADRRQAKRDLHRAGCRCTPDIVPDDLIAGATYCMIVAHQLGCPLGERVMPFNRAGVIPLIRATSPARCER